MSADPSEEPADAERSPPDGSTKLAPESASRADRLRAWVAANGLYVETALAVVTIGVGVLSLPFVTFGLFTALEGETSILAVGLVIAAGGLASLVALAATLLVHAHAELRRHGPSFGDGHGASAVAHAVGRGVETVTAGTFLAGLSAVAVSGIAAGSVPEPLPVVVGLSAVLLLVAVIAHGCGAVVGSLLGS